MTIILDHALVPSQNPAAAARVIGRKEDFLHQRRAAEPAMALPTNSLNLFSRFYALEVPHPSFGQTVRPRALTQ